MTGVQTCALPIFPYWPSTLLNDLETLDGQYGIESMCVAGGMGQAMLVERLN